MNVEERDGHRYPHHLLREERQQRPRPLHYATCIVRQVQAPTSLVMRSRIGCERVDEKRASMALERSSRAGRLACPNPISELAALDPELVPDGALVGVGLALHIQRGGGACCLPPPPRKASVWLGRSAGGEEAAKARGMKTTQMGRTKRSCAYRGARASWCEKGSMVGGV